MRIASNNRGFTLSEVAIVAAVMAMISVITVSIWLGCASAFDRTTSRTYADADAVNALQQCVQDVREARSVQIADGGKRLIVEFPATTADGYYNRFQSDSSKQVQYYLSDSTGTVGADGNWFWRKEADGTMQTIKRDVEDITFEMASPRSIKATVITEMESASGTQRTELTQRVVYLRNYY